MTIFQRQDKLKNIANAINNFVDTRQTPPTDEDLKFIAQALLAAGEGLDANEALGIKAQRGEDGHIASLFPNHPALFELSRKVLAVVGSKPPCERLTITSRVIVSAQTVFVFAKGRRKGAVLAEALKDPVDVSLLSVRLTIGGTWIMDHEAVSGFKAAMEGNTVRP